jgi:undecaprenyl-diphosphatase
LWKKRRQPLVAANLVVVTVGAFTMNPTMKYLLNRDRPALFPMRGMFNWESYPSGHAILTPALYFTLALLLYRARAWRWPAVAAAALVVVISYSRLYLGVHWPTDIAGGLLMGVVWLIGTWMAFTRYARSAAAGEGRRSPRSRPRAGSVVRT